MKQHAIEVAGSAIMYSRCLLGSSMSFAECILERKILAGQVHIFNKTISFDELLQQPFMGFESSSPIVGLFGVEFMSSGIHYHGFIGSKGEFCMRVSEFCKSLTSAAEYNTTEYDAVRCWGWMELVDIYGNTSEENVFRITVRKSEIDKINWDYFITDNIIQIGEDYWEANNIVY